MGKKTEQEREAEEQDAYKNEWVASPYTKLLRNELLRNREVALSTLVQACAVSTDSRILTAYMHFQVFERMATILETGER